MEILDGLGSHVFDSLTSSVAVLDADGTIIATNEAWDESAHGADLRPADSVGSNYLTVCDESSNSATTDTADGVRTVLNGDQEEFSLEYPNHTTDQQRWYRITVTRTEYEGDRYGIVTHRNITERKQSEQEVEESNKRLQQFAYAVSHDLQEPLRMITSYLELIDRRYSDELDEDGEEFIEFAVDGADRMRAMIDGLLDYSRIETRGDPFEPVDLDTVLEEACADLQMAIAANDIELTVESLPTVYGDRSQLRQLFQNLLQNAVKYASDEPPRVHIEATSNGPNWTISVSDNGIGIDPDDQDRIFDVFDRLHSHEEYDGTGIGLALCKRIVDRHGGEITVESEPGVGSTFFVTLPSPGD